MSTGQESQLLRGKACTSCRRRKMRCDGGRPFCGQCISGKRTEDCEYSDNQGRTRTQVLEENIALLQARIQELEDPNIAARKVFLHDPYKAFKEASMKGRGSSGPVPDDFELPNELVGLVLESGIELGFIFDTQRFKDSLKLPVHHPARPHPSLVYAIYLHGVRLSKDPKLQHLEEVFLQMCILSIQDAISSMNIQDRSKATHQMMCAIQAEGLLALHFKILGRLLEGRHHSSAACSMSVSCGLDRLGSLQPRTKNSPISPTVGSVTSLRSSYKLSPAIFELSPARDESEELERINLFWSVFACECAWASVTGFPSMFSDNTVAGSQVDTPWPSTTSTAPYGRTLHRFLAGEQGTLPSLTEGVFGLRARAAILNDKATRLVNEWFSDPSVDGRARIRGEVRNIARIISAFARSLQPVEDLTSQKRGQPVTRLGVEATVTLNVHALAHSAMATLHGIGASLNEASAINAALVHATEVMKIIEKVTDVQNGSNFVTPMLAMIGVSSAQVFLDEERRLLGDPPVTNISALPSAAQSRIAAARANVQRIIDAFKKVDSSYSPIFNEKAEAIELMRE